MQELIQTDSAAAPTGRFEQPRRRRNVAGICVALSTRPTANILSAGALSATLLIATASDASAALRGAPERGVDTAHALDLRLQETPLAQALAALARAASVELRVHGAVPDTRVDHELSGVDFREGARRLLSRLSYVLIEQPAPDAENAAPRRRYELLFLGVEAGVHEAAATVQESTPLQPRSSWPMDVEQPEPELLGSDNEVREPVEQESEAALADRAQFAASAVERASAVEALAYRDRNDEVTVALAASALSQALIDPEAPVRRHALTTLKDTSDDPPVEALSRIVREDVSAEVRIQALELLVERAADDSLPAVRAALEDSDANVRQRARELAAEWHIDL